VIAGPSTPGKAPGRAPPRSRSEDSALSVTLYGITTCDTVRKARAWLDGHGVAYAFHDYRAQGIDRARLAGWVVEAGWEKLLNRASTTFRGLDAADREGLDETKAIALMLAHPTLIKRPVVEGAGRLLVGFKPDAYTAAFA
jgi:Spx/MgsR family transcriptional regulator